MRLPWTVTASEYDKVFWGIVQDLADVQAYKYRYMLDRDAGLDANAASVALLAWISLNLAVATPSTKARSLPQPEDDARGPGTSVPAPYADVFVADRFRLKRVVCIAGNFKKLCGAVTSTHPGEEIVDVRFEGRGAAPDAALKVTDVVEES